MGVVILWGRTGLSWGLYLLHSFPLAAQDRPELDLERGGGSGWQARWGHSRQKEDCGPKEACEGVDCSTLPPGVVWAAGWVCLREGHTEERFEPIWEHWGENLWFGRCWGCCQMAPGAWG